MENMEKSEEKISTKSVSWMSYLPEVYRESEESFLYRFLKIFQSVYEDLTEQIATMPHRLYPQHSDMEILEWLAGWFDMENAGIWNREQLIYLLENRHRLIPIRGTKKYMEEMIRLFTGHMPFIVEYHALSRYKSDLKRTKQLERLYGDHAYAVTVVLSEQAVDNQKDIAILHRVMEDAAPAFIECRLVILQPCIFLDQYSYVGINSSLGGYQDLALNDNTLTPYVTVLGCKA